MSPSTRPLRSDDWPHLQAILAHSFNVHAPGWELFRRRIGDAGFRVVEQDGVLVGGCGVYAMAQRFRGRDVPLAGVAGVGVAPHARGQGAARALMDAVLREQSERGVALAGLYPATQALYRRSGYEQAGRRVQYELPLASLSGFHFECPVAPVPEADRDRIVERYRPAHGNLARTPAIWERIFDGPGVRRHAWTIGEQGYVVLQHSPDGDPRFDLDVLDLRAPDGPTLRTLLAFFGGHRSLATNVRWFGEPDDPLLCFAPEPTWRTCQDQRWMLRIVDLRAALEARGWPEDAAGALHLRVDDPLLSRNHGRFVLEVEGGRAALRPGGAGRLALPAGSLGPLYSGFLSASTLAAWERAEGDPASLALADRLFAAPSPWMREMY
jgi:predicted acetyltransferase